MTFQEGRDHPSTPSAAAATRIIERKMAEAVGLEPNSPDVAPSLAAMVEDIRAQLKTLNDKMEAGFKLAGQSITAIEHRLDDIEARATKIETFLHIPPALAAAIKEGGRP